MTEPPSKRQRGDLSSAVIYVTKQLPNRASKLRIWKANVPKLGGRIEEDVKPGITHVIVEPDAVDKLPPDLLPDAKSSGEPPPALVTPEWLAACLAQHGRASEVPFTVVAGTHGGTTSESDSELRIHKRSPGARFSEWLGHWKPEYDDMDQNELMLQVVYNIERSERIGNEPIVAALRALDKFEVAVGGDSRVGGYAAVPDGSPGGAASPTMSSDLVVSQADGDKRLQLSSAAGGARFGNAEPEEEVINYRALKYARAGAAVRACAVKLAVTSKGKLNVAVPYVGGALEAQIVDIIRTGTCTQLLQFRANKAVQDSRGVVRQDTTGGACKATFKKLPGVGAGMAKRWYDLGCRTYEDVEIGCEPGGILTPFSRTTITAEAKFSLMHRDDLLEDPVEAEVREMETATLAALRSVDGPGWRVVRVGGGQRGLPSHDADFVVTHDTDPERPEQGWVKRAVDRMLADGRLVGGDAMLRVQTERMAGHEARIKQDALKRGGRSSPLHNLNQDRFDHLFGMFRTAAGKVRRLDLIFVPKPEFAFGYLGWVGSRQFLRFLRQHAANRNMHLNSHRMTAVRNGQAWFVPDEGAPLDGSGEQTWPEGWSSGCAATEESHIFELLRTPYRPPSERNAG